MAYGVASVPSRVATEITFCSDQEYSISHFLRLAKRILEHRERTRCHKLGNTPGLPRSRTKSDTSFLQHVARCWDSIQGSGVRIGHQNKWRHVPLEQVLCLSPPPPSKARKRQDPLTESFSKDQILATATATANAPKPILDAPDHQLGHNLKQYQAKVCHDRTKIRRVGRVVLRKYRQRASPRSASDETGQPKPPDAPITLVDKRARPVHQDTQASMESGTALSVAKDKKPAKRTIFNAKKYANQFKKARRKIAALEQQPQQPEEVQTTKALPAEKVDDGAQVDKGNGPGEPSNSNPLEKAATTDTPTPAEHTTTIVTTQLPLPKYQPRLFMHSSSIWHTLTGHGKDFQRVPRFEWQALLGIASTGKEGIVQRDLRILTGQDMRSLPRRTTLLANKGLIVKRSVLRKGGKTSKLWLKRFAPPLLDSGPVDISSFGLADLHERVPWHDRWTGDQIDFLALGQTVIATIKTYGVLKHLDLKQKLGILDMRWQMRALARALRFWADCGVIQYVAASHDGVIYRDCLKYIHPPTDFQWKRYLATGGLSTTTPRRFLKQKEEEAVEKARKKMEQQQRKNKPVKVYPAWKYTKTSGWLPERTILHTIYESIRRYGTGGMTNRKLSRSVMSKHFQRIFSRITLHMSSRRPPRHLQHLSLVNRKHRLGKVLQYQYFTAKAYNKAMIQEAEDKASSLPPGSKAPKPKQIPAWTFRYSPNTFSKHRAAATSLTPKTLTDLAHEIEKPKRKPQVSKGTGRPVGRPKGSGAGPPKPRGRPRKKAQFAGRARKLANTQAKVSSKRPREGEEPPAPPAKKQRLEKVYLGEKNSLDPLGNNGKKKQGRPRKSIVFVFNLAAFSEGKREQLRISPPTPREPSPEIEQKKVTFAQEVEADEPPIRNGRGRPRPGGGRKGRDKAVGYTCDKCGGSWRNDNGLSYHLTKARTACNPNFDPSAIRTKSALKAASKAALTPDFDAPSTEPAEAVPKSSTGRPMRATRLRQKGIPQDPDQNSWSETESRRGKEKSKSDGKDQLLFVSETRRRREATNALSSTKRRIKRMRQVPLLPGVVPGFSSSLLPEEPSSESLTVHTTSNNTLAQLGNYGILDLGTCADLELAGEGQQTAPCLVPPSSGSGQPEKYKDKAKSQDRDRVGFKKRQKPRKQRPLEEKKAPNAHRAREQVVPPLRPGCGAPKAKAQSNGPGPLDAESASIKIHGIRTGRVSPVPHEATIPGEMPGFVPPRFHPEDAIEDIADVARAPTYFWIRRILEYLCYTNGGFFPGRQAAYLAMLHVWRRTITHLDIPSQRAVGHAVGKQAVGFEDILRDKHSSVVGPHVVQFQLLYLPGANPESPVAKLLKRRMETAHPMLYIPRAFAPAMDELKLFDVGIHKSLDRQHTGRGTRRLQPVIEVLDAPFYVNQTAYTPKKRQRPEPATETEAECEPEPEPEPKPQPEPEPYEPPTKRLRGLPRPNPMAKRPGRPKHYTWRGYGDTSVCLQDFETGCWNTDAQPSIGQRAPPKLLLKKFQTLPKPPNPGLDTLPPWFFSNGTATELAKKSLPIQFLESNTQLFAPEYDKAYQRAMSTVASQPQEPDIQKFSFAPIQIIANTPNDDGVVDDHDFSCDGTSFTMEGETFLAYLPSCLDEVPGDKYQKPQEPQGWETSRDICPNPAFDKFLHNNERIRLWEHKDKHNITAGSITPGTIFINHHVPREVFATFEGYPTAIEWLEGFQFTWDNLNFSYLGLLEKLGELQLQKGRREKKPKRKPQPRRPRRSHKRGAKQPVKADHRQPMSSWPKVKDDFTARLGFFGLRTGPKSSLTALEQRLIMTAFIVVTTLAGGASRTPDWGLMMRILPEFTTSAMKKFWLKARKERAGFVGQLISKFEQMFAEAYEKNQVPAINFQDIVAYDWKWLIKWAMDIDLVEDSIAFEFPDDIFDLVTRDEPKNMTNQDVDYRDTMYHKQASVFSRTRAFSAVASVVATLSVPKTDTAIQIAKARSYIKSLCCSPFRAQHSSEAVRSKLLALGNDKPELAEKLLTEAAKGLNYQSVIVKADRSVDPACGVYRLNANFLKNINRWCKVDRFDLATIFKTELDTAFRKNEEIKVQYDSEEGIILAFINLQCQGMLRLKGDDVPEITMGFHPGNYEARKFDTKKNLRWKVSVRPSEKWVYDDAMPFPVDGLVKTIPNLGPHGEVPMWRDIFGEPVPDLWCKMLAYFIMTLATKGPSSSSSDLCRIIKPHLEPFEVALLVEWCRNIGIISDLPCAADGFAASGWWWWVVGRVKHLHCGAEEIVVPHRMKTVDEGVRAKRTGPRSRHPTRAIRCAAQEVAFAARMVEKRVEEERRKKKLRKRQQEEERMMEREEEEDAREGLSSGSYIKAGGAGGSGGGEGKRKGKGKSGKGEIKKKERKPLKVPKMDTYVASGPRDMRMAIDKVRRARYSKKMAKYKEEQKRRKREDEMEKTRRYVKEHYGVDITGRKGEDNEDEDEGEEDEKL